MSHQPILQGAPVRAELSLSHELMDYLMDRRVGVIQYPVPETTAMGLCAIPRDVSSTIIFLSPTLQGTSFNSSSYDQEFLSQHYRLTVSSDWKTVPPVEFTGGNTK